MHNSLKRFSLVICVSVFATTILAGCGEKTHVVKSTNEKVELKVPESWKIEKDESLTDSAIIVINDAETMGARFMGMSKELLVDANGDALELKDISGDLFKKAFPDTEIEFKEISKDKIDDMNTISYNAKVDGTYAVISVLEDKENVYVVGSAAENKDDFKEDDYLEINQSLDIKEIPEYPSGEDLYEELSELLGEAVDDAKEAADEEEAKADVPTEPHTVASEDGKLEITVPGGWSLEKDLVDEDYPIAAANEDYDVYCDVEQILKEDATNDEGQPMTIDEAVTYAQEDYELTGFEEISADPVDGKPAKTYKFEIADEGEYYVSTVVEGTDKYYLTTVYTEEEDLYNVDEFQSITTSLVEK